MIAEVICWISDGNGGNLLPGNEVLISCGKGLAYQMDGGEVMEYQQPADLLHGVTLQAILTELVAKYGWEELGKRIDIRCFTHAPSIPSSLKFLRRTPWARDKVEEMYLRWKMEE